MSKKIVRTTIIGHFAFGKERFNGQTVKTKIVTEELTRQLGDAEVLKIDTYGGKITILKAPFHSLKALKRSQNVIIFPAHNGVRVYVPLLSFFKRFFKDRKLHYVVIGGWLPQFLNNHKSLVKKLKRFDGIYVETSTMKRALEDYGFTNVIVMPNCKNLKILKPEELVYPESLPYKLCTFSRVTKKKGIEDAVNAVKQINEEMGKAVYTLDIYGQVDTGQSQWFDDLKASFPSYLNYCGVVNYDKSVDVLKDYFALLFPTHYYTEGIPGTIIDAYAAGVPVIAAKWQNYADIVKDGKTGICFDFNNVSQLKSILLNFVNNSQIICVMKGNCLNEAKRYNTTTAIQVLLNKINE